MHGIYLDKVSFYHRSVWGVRESKGVKEITIGVRPGQILCIQGQNGSGKSTIIKLCMGFIEPVDGKITKPHKARLSYIGDSGRNLYLPLNLYENVRYAFAIRGLKHSSAIDEGIRKLCKTLGLEDYKKPISSMSRGMRQKAAIICALSLPYEFLFADEPTLGLDRASQVEFESILKARRDMGIAICLASNDTDMIGRISDAQLIMREGRLVGRSE